MTTEHPNKIKVKLSKEQKHYVGMLEQVEADIAKKKAALERAQTRVAKAQREVAELQGTLASLDKMKKGAEEYLSKTPPPPQWEYVFKQEYHYHYHQPWNPPVVYPAYPVYPYNVPNYTPWWSTVSCQGNVNLNAVKTIVTNCGLPASLNSGLLLNNGGPSNGSFSFTNAVGETIPASSGNLSLAPPVTSSITVNGSSLSSSAQCLNTLEIMPTDFKV